MSFRDNLQHLRATRNMTQEQLAMLLGVSRQSVSKWEAERAYPEMDKLLKICDLFGCTLDELVTGDLTSRSAHVAGSVPTAALPQDITGYDETMRAFAWKLSLGVVIILLGLGMAALLEGSCTLGQADPDTFSGIAIFTGIAAGLAVLLPAVFARDAFHKAHPFVEDFYTAEQRAAAQHRFVTFLVVGIACVMGGLIAVLLLQTDENLAGALFFLSVAVGGGLIIDGALFMDRCDIDGYNCESHREMSDDELDALDPQTREHVLREKRDGGIYGGIMCLATVVGLLLLFVPVFHAQAWFWVAWPVGGVLCGAVAGFRKAAR